MRRRLVGPLLTLVLLTAGCTGTARTVDAEEIPSAPFAACAGLATPPPVPPSLATPPPVSPSLATPPPVPPSLATPPPVSPSSDAGTPASAGAAAGEGRPIPAVTLPCFTSGDPVDVSALRGPAVVNLWASWCPPCRKELPVLQRFAERAAGSVHVIGVDTRDRRDRAESAGTDLGVTFPQLFDPDEKLLLALERRGVPITLFVDGAGRIRHIDESGALDDATLGRLVERHLGVVIAP